MIPGGLHRGAAFDTQLGFFVLSLLAGLAAAGFVALLDALFHRKDHQNPDAVPGQYTELPALERRGTTAERRQSSERRRIERRVSTAAVTE